MLKLTGRASAEFIRWSNLRQASSVLPKPNLKDLSIKNEPILNYLKGSKERKELEAALERVAATCEDVPIVVGNEEIRTKDVRYQVMPHNHRHKIAKFHYADSDVIQKAIKVSCEARKEWDKVPLQDRVDMWFRAADLMANKYRMDLNAATMLGQSKTVVQAEIDSAAELIDFFRFNAYFARELLKYEPISENPSSTKNSMRYRGLEGFVAAVAPFNFTAIGGNLAYTPALMGSGVLWKPSDTAILSCYTIFKVMKEVGFPAGVVNFVPADGPVFGDTVTDSPHLAGINFTGSVPTFLRLWSQVGQKIAKYINFPRLIGECGGKNYHFIHPSADVESVVNGTIRSAFEYCGQKCSACSRMYVPRSLWPMVKEGMVQIRNKLKVGPPTEYDTFMAAVIDEKAFERIKGYIEHAKSSQGCKIVGGGQYDNRQGYFVQPTIVEVSDPKDRLMAEEIFGPVLSVYVYDDAKVNETLNLLKTTSQFGLTGAVFAQDRDFQKQVLDDLKMTAGNFYLNDKSTGSVVGQQPFGGARSSGTNDKAGGPHYILRWTSPQSIKETFVPIRDWRYPYMEN